MTITHHVYLVESAAKEPEERSLFVLYPAVSTSNLARFSCGSNGRASRFHVMLLSSGPQVVAVENKDRKYLVRTY